MTVTSETSAGKAPADALVVYKFGGAALANAAAIQHAASLVAARLPAPTVVVTSAMAGVTDALLALALQSATGGAERAAAQLRALLGQHRAVAITLTTISRTESTGGTQSGSGTESAGGDGTATTSRAALLAIVDDAFATIGRLTAGVAATRVLAPARTDEIVAHGDRLAAQLLAAALAQLGYATVVIDATQLIVTDSRHGGATPDLARTERAAREVIQRALATTRIVIVPGFIGADATGAVTTLGRGGSDLSAIVLARALQVEDTILWKDVPGVLTADPRAVPDARSVPHLFVREAAELAYYGAKVLHPRALIPMTDRMRVFVRPFASPESAGTEISARHVRVKGPVKAVSATPLQALVTVSGNGMLGVPGVAARTFGALAKADISVSLISQASSEHSICLAIVDAAAPLAQDVLHEAFAPEIALGDIEGIDVRRGVVTIAVVGLGMAHTPGIAGRVFSALGDTGINVIAIAQGSSELNISIVVDAKHADKAQRVIHSAFRLHALRGGSGARARHRDVILLGFGRIGRELVRHLPGLSGSGRVRLRVVGIIDRGGFVFEPDGFSTQQLNALAAFKQRSQGSVAHWKTGRASTPLDALHFIASHALSAPVLVDLAVGDTRAVVHAAVAHAMDLVLANKVPLASDYRSAHALITEAQSRGRRVLFEATVGAGLPIIDTARKLLESGDRVWSIEGCPSGTMGFLFSELGRGRRFSEALRAAIVAGYTETDPRDDLCGLDVARKGVILGRLIGFTGELEDVPVESIVPEWLRAVPLEEFLSRIGEADDEWATRIADARARGEVLRYRARATKRDVAVRLVSVPVGSSLATLEGTDNQFIFTTTRYLSNPLVITGPGAGPAVTAAGVINDLFTLVGS